MLIYLNFGGFQIPGYGLMITLGVIVANALCFIIVKRENLNINDFFVLEGYSFLGAFVGAKLLYFIVSYRQIQWNHIVDAEYFNQIMQSGFVFYGGLILALIIIYATGKIHRINSSAYIRKLVFAIPLFHGFGRIGCYLADCCHGIPYNGIGAVIFPQNSLAPAGVSLFPVQLVEATCLFALSAAIIFLQLKRHFFYTIETYLAAYGIIRFILEFVRNDDARGKAGVLFTSQWISLFLIAASICSIYKTKREACMNPPGMPPN